MDTPGFTIRGHLFHIDPETRKKWLPSAEGPIGVSIFYDDTNDMYRLVACDSAQKVIMNSIMQANMNFTKTSAKFGQWSDKSSPGLNIYGLGFSSEVELNRFSDEFNRVKQLLRSQEVKTPPEQNSAPQNIPAKGEIITIESHPKRPPSRTEQQRTKTTTEQMVPRVRDPSPIPSVPTPTHRVLPPPQIAAAGLIKRDSQAEGNIDLLLDSTSTQVTGDADELDILKHENRRLRNALARSSENAKKWEEELQTLKNNNARLTAALQDSASNVTEWKTQLKGYKDESTRLKQMLQELEAKPSKDSVDSNSLSIELQQTIAQKSQLETKCLELQDKVSSIKSELDAVKLKASKDNYSIRSERDSIEDEKKRFMINMKKIENERDEMESNYREMAIENEELTERMNKKIEEINSAKLNIQQKFSEISTIFNDFQYSD